MTSINPASLNGVHRLLFKIALKPLQGSRFQPTGFPSLGAATYQTTNGMSLLVESTQSMANRLELTLWDSVKNDMREGFDGLSHVRVTRNGEFLTDTILESHRLNSPYLLEGKKSWVDPAGDDEVHGSGKPSGKRMTFLDTLKRELGVLETGPIDRRTLAKTLLKYDINSLLHGVFLVKKKLAGGRLRVARALSAFVEADNVQVAASGGVKNDHVNPSGDTKAGFGNVPFARDEYTAESITMYVNLDLAQIRGYGLGREAEDLLILLSLYKLRALTREEMRLRTACDLRVADEEIVATLPQGWMLPTLEALEEDVKSAIADCKDQMTVTCVTFEDELKKGKNSD